MKNKSLIIAMLLCFYSYLANAQYCIPSSGGSNCITNVSLNTLNNTTAGCPTSTNNFNIFTNTSNVFIGVSYTLQVTTNANSNVGVWIDLNQDSAFSSTEYFSVYNNSAIGSVGITLPFLTVTGLLRVRVRSVDPITMISATDACTVFLSGETEDYYIGATTISPCVNAPIGLITSASVNPVCIGDTTTLSIAPIPTVSGLQYQWQISSTSGGPWINIGGAFNPSHTIVVNNYRCYRCKIFCNTNPGLSELSSVFCVSTFPSPTSNDTVTLCLNQLPYNWNGNNINLFGNYSDTFTTVNGCDSIKNLVLYNQASPTNIISDTICQNQLPYVWNGNNYSTSGTYVDTLNSVNGCDSILMLNLSVIQALPNNMINDTICQNQLPYVWNGSSYTTSGTYVDTLITVLGCDSILMLNLFVKPSPSAIVSQSGATLTATQTSVTFQWIDCATNMVISNATASTFTATSNGTYAVVLNMNGCVGTSSCLAINNLHVNNVEEHLFNSIVPNPNCGKFNISLNQNCEVVIYDILGQMVWKENVKKGNYQIQLTNAVTGIYSIHLINEKSQQNVKVFIQN